MMAPPPTGTEYRLSSILDLGFRPVSQRSCLGHASGTVGDLKRVPGCFSTTNAGLIRPSQVICEANMEISARFENIHRQTRFVFEIF